MKDLLMAGVGGFIGTTARYGIYVWMIRNISEKSFLGTLWVNLIGCLIIGLLAGGMAKLTSQQSMLLITGFCGGFTTFSTYALDGFKLLKNGLYIQFFIYMSISVAGGLILCVAGYYIANRG